jgi:hypothetical protein
MRRNIEVREIERIEWEKLRENEETEGIHRHVVGEIERK